MKHGLNMNWRRSSLAWLLVTLAHSPFASAAQITSLGDGWLEGEPEFLPVDKAFVLSTDVAADGSILARWEMADGYYLYRHRFEFATRTSATVADVGVVLAEPEIPPGKKKIDDWFGEVEVYYHQAQARVPLAAGAGRVEVGISYQGCADRGLCYPPETKWVALDLGAQSAGAGPGVVARSMGPLATAGQTLALVLRDGGLLTSLLLFFLGGIALAFTPCVLPMVPILSSIIVGESATITRSRALSLSVTYVVGMALTYAVIGTSVGLFGASMNLQAALQSPTVLVTFALVFLALAFSMFGLYELQLPQSWQIGLNSVGQKLGGGKLASVFVMGSLSSLVVSPCVSAPLAGALIYISSTGDAMLGGGALLVLGLGMGVPLVLIGASGGHLLPRAGEWMNSVKAVFGVLLLAVAVWLLERVIAPALTLALWAALAMGVGVHLGALDFGPRQGWGQLWKAAGALSFIYGVLLLIGAASGAVDPLRPLHRVAGAGAGQTVMGAELDWQPVSNLGELAASLGAAGAQGQPAVLDLYADWCISCKVMERSVFPQPKVANRLAEFRMLRADVTDNNPDHQALLERFGLFGPPSLLFFSEDGSEMTEVRIQGDIDADRLAAHLEAVLRLSESNNVVEIAGNFG